MVRITPWRTSSAESKSASAASLARLTLPQISISQNADKSKVNEQLVQRYYDLLLREGNRQATLDIFKQRKYASAEKIKSISTPTLIIWGEEDQLIDVNNAYLFKKDIQGSELVIIPKTGHVPMEENPSSFLKALNKFIF